MADYDYYGMLDEPVARILVLVTFRFMLSFSVRCGRVYIIILLLQEVNIKTRDIFWIQINKTTFNMRM